MIHDSSMTIIISSIGLILFLAFSFFFSGTEAAFFSMNNLEREKFRDRATGKRKAFILDVLASPDRFLVTILTGNMIVNIFATDLFASALSVSIAERIRLVDPEVFSVAVMTTLIFVFGEMTPKNIAVRHPLAFSCAATGPIAAISLVLSPITTPLNTLRTRAMALFPAYTFRSEEKKETLVRFAVQIGLRKGILNRYEARLFDSYFDFRNKDVSDVMVPRTDIHGVDISVNIGELLDIIEADERALLDSYVIAYKKDLDHPRGYINAKDILPFKYGMKDPVPLARLVNPFHVVPETKLVNTLVKELRENKREVALIIDEYGGTSGFLTFKTMVREILEYFYAEDNDLIEEIAPGRYLIPGNMETEEVAKYFGVEIGTDVRTISGAIIERFDEIPQEGSSVTISGIEFHVKKVDRTRISLVEARRAVPG
jgi:putative hemolysin